MAWFRGPVTRAELDARYFAGQLPLSIADAMTLGEAAGLVLLLPAVTYNEGAPSGYGLFPPRGAEPVVKIGRSIRDVHNEPIPRGARGVVGCMWRDKTRPDRVVFRLFFRGETAPRMVDTWDDTIGAISGLEAVVPHTTGWQICRLDVPSVAPNELEHGVTPGKLFPGDA